MTNKYFKKMVKMNEKIIVSLSDIQKFKRALTFKVGKVIQEKMHSHCKELKNA